MIPSPSSSQQQQSTEDVDSARKRRVYVGNLAWSVSWQDLKDVMKTTGHEVTRADIMLTPDGRSKGCGIVEFATVEGAVQAVTELNDIELNGRRIFVREDREHRGGVGPATNPGRFNPYQHHQQQHHHHQYHGGGYNQFYQPSNYVGGVGQGITGTPGTNIRSQAQSRRVYVGNLSWDVSWQELKEHMWAVGNVFHAEIITEPNGRSKGCGIVEYSNEMEALQAISSMTNTELKGRNIFVREDREGSGGTMTGAYGRSQNLHHPGTGMNSSVFVWNLSYDTSWQDLKDHMRKAGNVNQVTILTNSNDGSSLGCGIVEYQKSQDAQRAIRELQDSELNGRPLKVREDRAGGSVGSRGGSSRQSGKETGGRGGYGGGERSEFRNFHQAPPTPIDSEPVPEGTQLYVGNLPYESNWKDLKDHFESAGEVIRVNVKMGYGTVRFSNKEDAEKAVATLNGVDFQGRTLNVRLDNKV